MRGLRCFTLAAGAGAVLSALLCLVGYWFVLGSPSTLGWFLGYFPAALVAPFSAAYILPPRQRGAAKAALLTAFPLGMTAALAWLYADAVASSRLGLAPYAVVAAFSVLLLPIAFIAALWAWEVATAA